MIIEDRRALISFSQCGPGCVFENGKGGIFIKIETGEDGINAVELNSGDCFAFLEDAQVQPLNATLIIE